MGLRSFAKTRTELVAGVAGVAGVAEATALVFILLVYGGIATKEGAWPDDCSCHPIPSLFHTLHGWIGLPLSLPILGLLLHLMVVVLLLHLLWHSTGGAGAMVGCLAFGVHPGLVEAVLTARAEVFAAVFSAVAIFLHLRKGWLGKVGPWMPIVLALLCHDAAIALPAILLIHDLVRAPRSARSLGWHAGSMAVATTVFSWRCLWGSPLFAHPIDFGLPFDWTHRFSSLVLSLVPSLAIPFLPAISIEPTNALAILVFLLVMAASFALFAMARRSSQHSSQHSSLRIDFIALGWVFSVLMLLSTAFTHPKGDGAGYLPALGLAIALSAAFETLLSHLRKRRSPRWMLHVLAGIVGLIWLSLAWTASDRVHHWQPVESKAKERQESRSKEATHDLDIGKG